MSKGRFARNKGKRGERLLADELRAAFPHYAPDIRRGWQARAGDDEPDVIFPGIHFEHKNCAKPSPLAALRQALGDAKPGNVPIAVLRQTRSYPVACLLWTDLLAMLVELDKRKEIENVGHRVQAGKRWVLRAGGAKKRR